MGDRILLRPAERCLRCERGAAGLGCARGVDVCDVGCDDVEALALGGVAHEAWLRASGWWERLPVLQRPRFAHGAEYKGRPAGSMGDIGCFSISAYKIVGAWLLDRPRPVLRRLAGRVRWVKIGLEMFSACPTEVVCVSTWPPAARSRLRW